MLFSFETIFSIFDDMKVYCHGEDLPVHISINNHSKKAVKNIRVNINQHCELTMINAQYSCKVILKWIPCIDSKNSGSKTGVNGWVSYTTRVNHEPDFCTETFGPGIGSNQQCNRIESLHHRQGKGRQVFEVGFKLELWIVLAALFFHFYLVCISWVG